MLNDEHLRLANHVDHVSSRVEAKHLVKNGLEGFRCPRTPGAINWREASVRDSDQNVVVGHVIKGWVQAQVHYEIYLNKAIYF